MRIRASSLSCLLLIALLALHPASAVGIRGPSPSELSFTFAAGETRDIKFLAEGADNISVSLEGDLAPYATLEDAAPNTGQRVVTLHIKLPDKLPPGEHFLYLVATEIQPPGQFVGGIASVRRIIRVMSLYDDPLAVITGFTVESVAVNTSTTTATASVRSLTKQDLTVSAEFSLIDTNGTTLSRVAAPPQTLPSDTTATLTARLPTATLTPGPFGSLVVVRYARNETNATTTFKVGNMELSLRDYPPNLTAGKVNKFLFSAESNWNRELDGYGVVTLGPLSEKTPDTTFPRFGAAELKTYLDLSDIPVSQLNGTIKLVYHDPSSPDRAENVRLFNITVNVVNETVPGTESDQQPSALLAWLKKPIVLLYIGLALLVILNLFLLLRRRKESAAAQPSSPPPRQPPRGET
jgi:hypothetical protein